MKSDSDFSFLTPVRSWWRRTTLAFVCTTWGTCRCPWSTKATWTAAVRSKLASGEEAICVATPPTTSTCDNSNKNMDTPISVMFCMFFFLSTAFTYQWYLNWFLNTVCVWKVNLTKNICPKSKCSIINVHLNKWIIPAVELGYESYKTRFF